MYGTRSMTSIDSVCAAGSQNVSVTHSAARFASHATTHTRSSGRRVERASTTKKRAISSADVICTAVLQRQSWTSMTACPRSR